LGDPGSHAWLAEVGPGLAPVGYLVLTKPDLPLPDLGPGDLEVKRIYLLSRFQGGGIGRNLMRAAEAVARGAGVRRLLLGVYSGNAAAIAFYRRLGYVQAGERSFQVGATTYHDLVFAVTLADAAGA